MFKFGDIIYKFLELQEKILRFRLAKTIGAKNNSKRKIRYADGCKLDLNSLAEVEKERFENELIGILTRFEYNPRKILEYVRTQGTGVKFVNNADKVLTLIQENEGFISPTTGLKALYLSLAFDNKFAFKTKEMFVLSKGEINKYYFLYHIYNWFAFKHNIEGMDIEAQQLLKKYLFSNEDTSELQLEDIYKLKDAIKQDKAAIEFVVKLCRHYDGAKQALQKIQENGSANL